MNFLPSGMFRGFQTVLYVSKTLRTFSTLSPSPLSKFTLQTRDTFLAPAIFNTQQSAGMKDVLNPKRRCINCYVVIKDERKYVFCDKFPRHKQVSRHPRNMRKNEMIMTHATQGGFNYGNGRGRMSMWCQQRFRMDF